MRSLPTPLRPQVIALTLALTAIAIVAAEHAPRAALADPLHCVVIKDGQGNPIDTICVPGFARSVSSTSRSAAV